MFKNEYVIEESQILPKMLKISVLLAVKLFCRRPSLLLLSLELLRSKVSVVFFPSLNTSTSPVSKSCLKYQIKYTGCPNKKGYGRNFREK